MAQSSNKSAKAVLYEKAKNYEKTSEILLSQLQPGSSKFSTSLNVFLAFVQRSSNFLSPGILSQHLHLFQTFRKRIENVFFSQFLTFSTTCQLKIYKSTCHVRSVASSDTFQCQKLFKLSLLSSIRAPSMVSLHFSVFIKISNQEVPFGPMKQLVTTILDSTTRDVTNLLQMTRITESGRFSEQAELAQTRKRAIIGGLPGASCNLSGKKLGRDSRVLFREENKEYAFESIKLDPEENPSQSVYGLNAHKINLFIFTSLRSETSQTLPRRRTFLRIRRL